MNYQYVDESGELLSLEDLKKEYYSLKENGSFDDEVSFNGWLDDCLSKNGHLMTIDDAFLNMPFLLEGHDDIVEEEFNKMKNRNISGVSSYDNWQDYLNEKTASKLDKIASKIAQKGTIETFLYHHYGDIIWSDTVEIISRNGNISEEEAVNDMNSIAPEFKHTDTYETNGYGGIKNVHYVFIGVRPGDERLQKISDIQKKAKALGYRLKN